MYSTLLFLKGEFIDIYCNVIIEAIICCYLHHDWLVRRGFVVNYITLLFVKREFVVIYSTLML